MKTRIKELEEQLQIEKEKIKQIKAEINDIRKSIKNENAKIKYPMKLVDVGFWFSWVDSPIISKHHLFARLVETCKEWNKIDGFEPDWNSDKEKVCICYAENKVQVGFATTASRPLCFKNTQTARLFFDTYRTELEQVKDLI